MTSLHLRFRSLAVLLFCVATHTAALASPKASGPGHTDNGLISEAAAAATAGLRVLDVNARYAIPLTSAIIDGPVNAKVTVVFISEYACKFSAKSQPTIAALKAAYGKKIRFAYLQHVVHKATATAPALAACAANKQNAFSAVNKALWKSQLFNNSGFRRNEYECWLTPDGCPAINAIVTQLSLDREAFYGAMQGACGAELAATRAMLNDFAVIGTPTWFINGRPVNGAKPTVELKKLIDQELKALGNTAASNDIYETHVMRKGLARVN